MFISGWVHYSFELEMPLDTPPGHPGLALPLRSGPPDHSRTPRPQLPWGGSPAFALALSPRPGDPAFHLALVLVTLSVYQSSTHRPGAAATTFHVVLEESEIQMGHSKALLAS